MFYFVASRTLTEWKNRAMILTQCVSGVDVRREDILMGIPVYGVKSKPYQQARKNSVAEQQKTQSDVYKQGTRGINGVSDQFVGVL